MPRHTPLYSAIDAGCASLSTRPVSDRADADRAGRDGHQRPENTAVRPAGHRHNTCTAAGGSQRICPWCVIPLADRGRSICWHASLRKETKRANETSRALYQPMYCSWRHGPHLNHDKHGPTGFQACETGRAAAPGVFARCRWIACCWLQFAVFQWHNSLISGLLHAKHTGLRRRRLRSCHRNPVSNASSDTAAASLRHADQGRQGQSRGQQDHKASSKLQPG